MFFFSKIFTHRIIDSIEKKVIIPRKNVGLWFEICLIWKLMEYTNDHSPNASIIPIFQNKFLKAETNSL